MGPIKEMHVLMVDVNCLKSNHLNTFDIVMCSIDMLWWLPLV